MPELVLVAGAAASKLVSVAVVAGVVVSPLSQVMPNLSAKLLVRFVSNFSEFTIHVLNCCGAGGGGGGGQVGVVEGSSD